MYKYLSLALGLLLLNTNTFSQIQDCSWLECFSANTSLQNSCEEFKTYARIRNFSNTLNFPSVTATWDFGDFSGPVSTSTALGSNTMWVPETTHAYSAPGTYVATLTVVGGQPGVTCISKATVTVDVTGACESCSTYSVLSTGYDPATASPVTAATLTAGTPDPKWLVLRRFNLDPSTYTVLPGTKFDYSSTSANVIYPKDGYCPTPPLGRSRFISVNSYHSSVHSTPNIFTYRRSFMLPSTLPTSSMYSLIMSIQALDYVFDVQLNGTSILANALPGSGPVQISINSCTGIFQPDSNFIDITVANTVGTSTQLDAEIILYDCPLMTPCPTGSGWTQTWNWNTSWSYGWSTNWGYGWWWYWYYNWWWYWGGSGSGWGGGAPSGGFGSLSGWGWTWISGWGWVWVQGGSSGSGSSSCPNCISSFAPTPGKKYLLSAWVKEKNPPQSRTTYTYPEITVLFPSISGSAGPFTAAGNIIDGWQRIEAEFTIPAGASDMDIKLDCTTGDCYFDDVRMLPFDGSMKSYVYDPTNMRLVAELDERNFATLYEYDEEGKLIRIKKETEKGKMTIKENRDNTRK